MRKLLFRNYDPLVAWMVSVTWTVGALGAAFLLFWVKDTLGTGPIAAIIVGMLVMLGFWIDLKSLQTPMVSIWQKAW